jgi:hypothetical protein
MNLRIKTASLLLITAFMILNTCSMPSEPEESAVLAAEFTSFQLTTEDNPSLPASVSGTFDGDKILLKYPDTMIPGFRWIPRFETEAVSVEVDGQPQVSVGAIQDFSTPVNYTLTAASGLTQKIQVELLLQPGWGDMGFNPVQIAGAGVHNIRTGFLMDLNPYVICRDTALNMKAYMLELAAGSWTEHNAGVPPFGVLSFDALSWNGQVWTVYENNAGLVEAQSMVPPNNWSGANAVMGTSGTDNLHVFKGSASSLFAAWIEDPAGSKTPMVWKTLDGISWTQVGSGLSSLHADRFAAVSSGGTDLYGVCTFSENPGTLHYFEYDWAADQWNMTLDGGILNKEEGQIVLRMFYDSDKRVPVVFTAVPLDSDSGFYQIRALYWSPTASVWTNLNYVKPITVRAADLVSLSFDWFENRPSIAVGKTVMTWKEGAWKAVGSQYTTDTPVLQSLSTGVLNTSMAAYTTDATVGELIVRYIQ